MIIYYTYTVISTVLTIFKNFSSSLHDNVLHQGKHHFNASIVERIRHTGKYCDERFLCYNGDMSINFLSIFSELNRFAYAQIHVRVAYLFFKQVVGVHEITSARKPTPRVTQWRW